MNVRPHSAVVPAVTSPSIGLLDPFVLVDVGASGGIGDYWRAFGDSLHAVGFDPLVTNVNKLAAAEKRPGVRYEAAYVGCRGFDSMFPPEQRQVRVDPYLRVSAVRAQELMRIDFVADDQNEGDELVWSETHVTLDEYFPAESPLDFLKIDTDGSDLQVLLGADRLLRSGAFLGIMIEAQFQGWPHDCANTFANIDRRLRSRGFMLYDIDLHRYTRAALPGMFARELAAETTSGQVLWGDALYFRDLAHSHYEQTWQYTVTRERLLKLVALFDLHALPDCAAELLQARADLTTDAERTRLLDLLTRSIGGEASYAEHRRRFEEQPRSFFPRSPQPAPPPPATQAGGAHRLRARLSRLKRLLGV